MLLPVRELYRPKKLNAPDPAELFVNVSASPKDSAHVRE